MISPMRQNYPTPPRPDEVDTLLDKSFYRAELEVAIEPAEHPPKKHPIAWRIEQWLECLNPVADHPLLQKLHVDAAHRCV